ncbi:MAG: hypothetical protein M3178_13425 [Pseudomonadota bacterium]|nr:hypothetical protein [Pseudomonadota bacterium]
MKEYGSTEPITIRVQLYDDPDSPSLSKFLCLSFFTMISAVAASAGVVIWSFQRPLKGMLHG